MNKPVPKSLTVYVTRADFYINHKDKIGGALANALRRQFAAEKKAIKAQGANKNG